MSPQAIGRVVLVGAGLFDGILGAAFLAAAPGVFALCGIPEPNHWGYVHFGAALLLIFALMFFAAAIRPAANRSLIAYGMLLKVAYVGVVGYHWVFGDVPTIFKVFAALDSVWFVVLVWVFYTLGRAAVPQSQGGSVPQAPSL